MSRPLNTEKSPAAVRRGYHPDDGRFFGPGDRDKMTRGRRKSAIYWTGDTGRRRQYPLWETTTCCPNASARP